MTDIGVGRATTQQDYLMAEALGCIREAVSRMLDLKMTPDDFVARIENIMAEYDGISPEL
jgi:hypothetical protein